MLISIEGPLRDENKTVILTTKTSHEEHFKNKVAFAIHYFTSDNGDNSKSKILNRLHTRDVKRIVEIKTNKK